MMKHFLTGSLAVAMGISALTATAQQPVDIGMFSDGNHLEVRVRPQAEFSGIFSAVVFTIRWDRNSGASLGDIIQEGGPERYIPIIRSGGVHQDGPFNYQIFAGFGFDPMHTLDKSWTPGQEYTIMRIPVQGKAEFELVVDDWTNELHNNGDYYLSLGGVDRTGVIYKGLVREEDMSNVVSIMPNPNRGEFAFQFAVPEVTDLHFEIFNSLGQSVYTDVVRGFRGEFRRDMDLRRMGAGVYFLNITAGDEKSVHKIVID
jgi:hypothetical protein